MDTAVRLAFEGVCGIGVDASSVYGTLSLKPLSLRGDGSTGASSEAIDVEAGNPALGVLLYRAEAYASIKLLCVTSSARAMAAV